MIDFFYSLDLATFYFMNNTISNPLFDKFFPFITNVKHWYIAYIIVWSILIFKGGRIGKIAAIGIILLIVASDQFSSSFLKNLFDRIRPCNELSDVNILVHCSGSYSFPSSHAVNNFAVAFYFYKLYPNLKWTLFSIASIIVLSRPYVGVHYPSDIVVGAIIGIILGYVFAYLTIKIYYYTEQKVNRNEDKD